MTDLEADLLDPGNDWSNRIRDRVLGLSPELTDLVLHLGAASGFWNYQYKVDAAWKRRTRVLLKGDGAEELVRDVVRELAWGGSFHGMTDPHHVMRELGQNRPPSPARGLAIGFLLAAGLLREAGAELAADLALTARKNVQAMDTYYRVDDDLAGAAFTALGELPGPAAMEELWTLHYWVSPSRHAHKVLVKAVKKAAARLGVPPHELAERTVPRHGLDRDGTLTLGWMGRGALWWNVPFDTVITVHGTGQVTVDWIDDDGTATRTTAPYRSPYGFKARTHGESVDAVRRQAKDIQQTLASERLRLALLADEKRSWVLADWVRYYRDHPVTGVVTRSLEWEYEVPGGGRDHRPLDIGADVRAIPATARVRLRPQAEAEADPARLS